MVEKHLNVGYLNSDKRFVQLYNNNKPVGLPILSVHYWSIRDEKNLDETHDFLFNLTQSEWDMIHMYGILDWRNHGIAG